jgi:hypothetical protein
MLSENKLQRVTVAAAGVKVGATKERTASRLGMPGEDAAPPCGLERHPHTAFRRG